MEVKLLALDTSSSACSVALLLEERIHSSHQIAPMQQTTLILPAIEKLLSQTQTTLKQLDAIVFGCGPGSFTGVRIASCVAQGLGLAAGLPIIRVSSLAALAQTAFNETQAKNLLVAVDARMQQIYWAVYQINSVGLAELIGDEQLCKPDEVSLTTGEWYGVGDGWQVIGESRYPITVDSALLPQAAALLPLARAKLVSGEVVPVHEALPTYLR